jgi:hypothetical protein
MASSEGRQFIAQAKGIDVFSKDKLVETVATDFTPTQIAAFGSLVAVGTDLNTIGE